MPYQPFDRPNYDLWHKARMFEIKGMRLRTGAAHGDRQELYHLLHRTEDLALQIAREEVECRRWNRDSTRKLKLIEDLEIAKSAYDQQVVMFKLMHG